MWRIGGILLLLLLPVFGQDAVKARALDGALPTIDGRATDLAWRGIEPARLEKIEQIHPNYRADWSGPADLSGRVRAAYTDTDLYLLIEVEDDAIVHEPGRQFWVGDTIELFLDSDRVTDPDEKSYSADDRQIFLMPFNEGVKWSVVSRGAGVPYPSGGLSGIELAHTRRATGYTVEVRIPLAPLAPIRPDAKGHIGFDIAINDVDTPAAEMTESYMTLSGRQDLFADPTRFGRLVIAPTPPGAVQVADEEQGGVLPFPVSQLMWGLAGVVVLSLLVRASAHRLSGRGRSSLFLICGASAALAALLAFVPSLVSALDERQAPGRWTPEIDSVRDAVQGCLDLDSGPSERRAARLLRLLGSGSVRTRPRYAFTLLPLIPDTDSQTPRYGITIEPGETRRFPLLGRAAPAQVVTRWLVRDPEGRAETGTFAARVRIEFEEGAETIFSVPPDRNPVVVTGLGPRAGGTMRALHVTNTLSFRPIVLDSFVAVDEQGARSSLPLATPTPRGIPIDNWQGRPDARVVRLEHGATRTIPVAGVAGHRLWIAVRPSGAYPDTPYGADAVRLRVIYRGGEAGPESVLRNGIDLKSSALLLATRETGPVEIASVWTRTGIIPQAITLHTLALDPGRAVEAIEVTELGVLTSFRVEAATIGRRTAAAPSIDSGLVLDGERLTVRPEVRETWAPFTFAIYAPGGRRFGNPRRGGVEERILLRFGLDSEGALAIELPRAGWALATRNNSNAYYGLAALGLAFATVLAGAALLGRARRLRVKMLVAVGTATVVPLVFLVVALTSELSRAAESELATTTHADQRSVRERILGWRARVSARASLLRDTVEPVRVRGGAPLRTLLERQRARAHTEGLILRVPGIDEATPFQNTNVIDATRVSCLLATPWDGLMGIGVARAEGRRRYLVAAPAAVLLGPPPSRDVAAVIYAMDGSTLASTRGRAHALNTAQRRARIAPIAEELRLGGQDIYRRSTPLFGGRWAASYSLLRSGGEPVGVLGVYRSRQETEASKKGLLRTLLLAALAALLLVVLSGGMLVEGVTTRLLRVTDAARSIARGDLESRVPVEAEDEVDQLARSFNAMADALDERVGQLSQLHRGQQELAAALDREEVGRIAARLLAAATGARNVSIAAYDRNTERLEALHRVGDPAPIGDHLPERGPARRAVQNARPVLAEGGAIVPLLAADRVVGLAQCAPVAESADLDYLDASARQIGIALENARLYLAAVTDELTGLYAMTFLRRRLGEEVDRAAEAGRPLSLLRVGADNHAAILRAHGPQAAARVVAESAEIFARELPPRAVAARHDMGELVALLVESDADDARERLARVRTALDRHEFAWLDGMHHPIFHEQVVSYPEDGSSTEILLARLFESAETAPARSTGNEIALHVPAHMPILLAASPAMRTTLDIVARVAPTTATVLLSGETGVGKEVIADLVQGNSDRADAAYVKVNCGAIVESLVESELFGHEKGAFTGADRRRIGRFEEASGGTLFLDEIGELPPAMQVKLLRVLQERRFTRVGGTEPVVVDVRIIAASNRDLAAAVREGEFREDLFHRLHVIELHVPPLRERREEVPQLVEHFRREFNRRHGLDVESFRPDALDALYHQPWPGNVRQLRNVVERAMLFADDHVIERHHLSLPESEGNAGTGHAPRGGGVHGLTPRQERILKLARETGGLTNRDIVASEEVSARTALRELQTLVERGLLARVGRRRGAVYKPADG